MKNFSILFVLFSLILCNSSFAATVEAANVKTEWQIEQMFNDTEPHRIFLSPDAVKIIFLGQGFTVVAKAPDWDAYCFRADNKKMWIGKFDTFTGDLLVNPFAIPKYRTETPMPGDDVVYDGQPCRKYISDREGSVIYGSKAITLPPKECEFLCRYYNIPKMHAVPLYRTIEPAVKLDRDPRISSAKVWTTDNSLREHRDHKRVVLTTKSIKQIAYRAADFDVPKERVAVKDAGDIGMTGAQRSQIGAALDELGFSSDYVRSAKGSK